MEKNVSNEKDTIEYNLTKIYSILDQQNMGMSMRVERSNVDQVRKRIEMNKSKQKEVVKEFDFEERMRELKEEVIDL